MKAMKMAWVPYDPLEDRYFYAIYVELLSRIDGLKTKIFTLCCTQRRSALKHLKTERVKKFDYCMPYYMPLIPPEDDHDTTVNIIYPLEPPIVCPFDWEEDDYEEFLKEKVRERKRELKQDKQARKKAIDDMDPTIKEAYENIQFYKFYPVKALDAPELSIKKANYINRYYGKAHHCR